MVAHYIFWTGITTCIVIGCTIKDNVPYITNTVKSW